MKIGVIGAGAWGTTIAIHLATKGYDVSLWSHETDLIERMKESRTNDKYLPGIDLPNNVTPVTECAPDWELLVNGVPTQYVRAIYTKIKDSLPRATLVSLSKGIEIGTGRLPTQVLAEVLGEDWPTAVLTGPCIAKEVGRGLPTAVVIAGDDAERLQEVFSSDRFRVYTTPDKLGAELSSALKNVMGIAAGIVDGLGLGDNAKALKKAFEELIHFQSWPLNSLLKGWVKINQKKVWRVGLKWPMTGLLEDLRTSLH